MQPLLRTSALIFIIGLLTIGIDLLRSGLFGIPFSCSSSNLLTEMRREEELQLWRKVQWHHREGQYQAVREWLAQRCTLAVTMWQFQELEREFAQEWPPFRDTMRQEFPLSSEERHYLVIVEHLEGILRGRPEELTVARRRLENEYQQPRNTKTRKYEKPKKTKGEERQ